MSEMPTATKPRAAYVSIWFALDAVLALFPPVYWVFAGPTPQIFRLPGSIIYFVALVIFIAASIVAAYLDDERRGAFEVRGEPLG